MPAYRVHKVVERDPLYRRIVFPAFLALSAAFTVWRTWIVDWDVWFGPLAWATELFALATSVLFVTSMRTVVRPVPRVVTDVAPRADVLVPTVNEPLPILEATVLGALNIRGVRHVLVLDDGVRDDVRDLAARLGAGYVPRVSDEGSKAGNLNHGLLRTDAEFVVVLDADHVPLPEFLEQTLGYFDDPSVGFVQSPQSFYNTDSFTFRRSRGVEGGWHEQGMFYGAVLPTKDASNSAMFAGTSAVLRRSALDSVGGFAVDTPTEDIHTSIRLHAAGWQSVYLDRPLAYGLEVENLQEYYRTRRRWAQGSLQLLFRHPDSPLRIPGLSLRQRLNYLSAMIAHLQGLNRLLYLLLPLAALLSGVAPVHGAYARYGFAFLASSALSLGVVVVLGRGHFHLLHSEVFGVTDEVAMLSGLGTLVRGPQRFQVSVKQAGRTAGTRLKVWYAVLAAVALVGLVVALTRLARGEVVAIAAWAAAFLALNLAYRVAFFVALRRYERQTGSGTAAPHAGLGAEALYRHILALPARATA